MNKKAFTLVELIVVITILAVLGTIAFVSFQDYVLNSRDSKRTTDIKNIEKALELSKLQTGVYPMPGNASAITFSGATAWEQGEFNNDVTRVVRNFKEAPKDPLVDTFYGYSVTKNRGEYQLGAVLEESDYGTSANGKLAAAYVKGNYNGKTVKVSTGSTTYILGAPSILTSDLNETDLIDIINAKKLVYKGHQNLPASYTGTTYDLNGGFDFSPATIVAYEGDLASVDSNTLVDNLQQIYTGTVISEEPDIEVIFSEDKDLTTDVILNKRPGTTASSGGSGGGSSNNSYNPIAASCMEMTQQHVDNLNSSLVTLGSESDYNISDELTLTQWCTLGVLKSQFALDIPDEVGNLTQITEIDMRVSSISPNISLLENLDWVNLRGESLPDITLPSDLSKWTKIRHFGLFDMKIENPISLGTINSQSLYRLYLNNIGLENLDFLQTMGGLTGLKHLYLWDNNISDISGLNSLSYIDRLYIHNNNVTDLSVVSDLSIGPNLLIKMDCDEVINKATIGGNLYNSLASSTPVRCVVPPSIATDNSPSNVNKLFQ